MKTLNNMESEFVFEKEVISDINNEYQDFIGKKESIVALIKENQRILINDIENLKFTALDNFLSTKFTMIHKKNLIHCNICSKYTSTGLKGMAAHKRGCKKKYPVILY